VRVGAAEVWGESEKLTGEQLRFGRLHTEVERSSISAAKRDLDGGLGRGGYSMTWSARSRSDGGIVRPRAFAVLRLMTSSNLVGCSIGRSDGLAPLRMRTTNIAALRNIASVLCA